MQADALFREGRLAEAVKAAGEEVKARPSELGPRWLLAELLAFSGDFERAEKQLMAVMQMHVDATPAIAIFQQLLRAAVARNQLFTEGRVPEVLEQPSADIRLRLEALVHERAGDEAKCVQSLAAAEENRKPLPGTHGGIAFTDFRDLDDLTASVLEVLTTSGKYYWVPLSELTSIEFLPPKRPRDLLWRQMRFSVADIENGEAYTPVVYWSAPAADDDEAMRLGRATDWTEVQGTMRGIGQKTFLVGDEAVPIMQLTELTLLGKE